MSEKERDPLDEALPLNGEEQLEGFEGEDVDMEEEMAQEQLFDTQHSDGHTYNPHHAQDQGLTYTPPSDPPVVASRDDPKGAEIAAGFAPSMEEAGPGRRTPPTGSRPRDLDLQERVQKALRYNSETAHLTDIQVEVEEGVVSLRGTVLDSDDIGIVYDIVNELDGVVNVESHLEIQL